MTTPDWDKLYKVKKSPLQIYEGKKAEARLLRTTAQIIRKNANPRGWIGRFILATQLKLLNSIADQYDEDADKKWPTVSRGA